MSYVQPHGDKDVGGHLTSPVIGFDSAGVINKAKIQVNEKDSDNHSDEDASEDSDSEQEA